LPDISHIERGTIALETFRTEALFDSIRLAPKKDIDLEYYWKGKGGNEPEQWE